MTKLLDEVLIIHDNYRVILVKISQSRKIGTTDILS